MHNLVMAVIPAVNRENQMSNKSYAVNRFDYAVKRAVDYRKTLAEYLAKAKVQRKKMVSLAKQLCKEQTESISMYFDVDSHEPFLRVTLEDLESFKDDRLVSRLWYLSNLDGVREPKSSDWAMSLNRDYRFDFDGFSVTISAYVKSDSPTCRKVVIGSKTEVINEYKIVCD
jgi:hypothetical protein